MKRLMMIFKNFRLVFDTTEIGVGNIVPHHKNKEFRKLVNKRSHVYAKSIDLINTVSKAGYTKVKKRKVTF